MMQPPAPPAAIVTATVEAPAGVVVVGRDTRSDVVANADTPLPLIKARHTEKALLRQLIFVTGTLTLVRAGTPAGADETLRWTYEPFLQRQLCFTSITGQFSCAAAEVEALTEKADGQAPVAPQPAEGTAALQSPEAEAARMAVAASLQARAGAIFSEDRRLKIDPLLKAAKVAVQKTAPTAAERR